MNLNEGKPEKSFYDFLGTRFRVDKIPVALAVPFSVEVTKLRAMSLKAAEKVALKTDSVENLQERVTEYFTDNLEEAQKFNEQSVKVVSIVTEFYTDGEMDYDHLMFNADIDEINDFIEALEGAINNPIKKRLEKLQKLAQSKN
jgi:hypothetical protein